MKRVQYAAAGGVVVQRGIVPDLSVEETHLLLLDRPRRAEVRLPKGHIDPGESAEEAALRETCEESGYCDLRILADLGRRTVEFEYKGRHYLREDHYYLMRLLSARQTPRPAGDARQFRAMWVPLSEASERLTFEIEQLFAQDAAVALRNLPVL